MLKIISLILIAQLTFFTKLLFSNYIPNDYNNLTPNKLLQSAFNLEIRKYFQDGAYIYSNIDKTQTEIQRDLIEQALQMGANLNHFLETQYTSPSLDVLYAHKELFLSQLNPNTFLKLTLATDISTIKFIRLKNHVKIDRSHQIDAKFAQQQSELLQLILNQGADLNQILGTWITSININTLFINKDLMLNEIGPHKFLILLAYSNIQLNTVHKKLQLELAQLAINLGANPNLKTNGIEILLSSSFEHTIDLLQLLVDNGARKTSYSRMQEEMIEAGLDAAIRDPQFILDQKYKNLQADESLEPKIPSILHHIWLTHSDAPKEIQDKDIANLIATKSLFSKASVPWQHILWTNDPQLFPQSATQLEQAGIEVKSIYQYQENLQLFPLIESLIDKKKWGQACDILRIALLEHFGGVYADLDYIFNRHVTSEIHKYNFFTSTYEDHYLANFFLGSSPGHPILQKALDFIKRNLTTPPAYLANEDQNSPIITNLLTANPIYLAYYSQANQNGNIDVIYPSTSHYRKSTMYPNYNPQNQNIQTSTPNGEKVNNILKSICPMIHFIDYIKANEICATEDHFIGYDSPSEQTWLNP